MSDNTAKKWFIRKFTRDLFVISAITWIILFVLENLKTGIVSNYVSLPHAAVLLVFFGILALFFSQPYSDQPEKKFTKTEIVVLLILSVLVSLFLAFVIEASTALTVLIIIVTVFALWAGTLILKDSN